MSGDRDRFVAFVNAEFGRDFATYDPARAWLLTTEGQAALAETVEELGPGLGFAPDARPPGAEQEALPYGQAVVASVLSNELESDFIH